jgi:hypothetical protein
MYTTKQVVEKLREASTKIQNLANDKEALLQKVASLEEELASAVVAQPENNHMVEDPSALQKQAAMEFTPRGGSGFGSTTEDLPQLSDDLTAEQRLDMILSGESPSDYDN